MKKKLYLFLLGLLVVSIMIIIYYRTANDHTKQSDAASGYEIALVIDAGTIEDKSFNHGIWKGLKNYAEAHDKTYQCYHSENLSIASFEAAIKTAIEAGAKVVVCSGNLFEPVIYTVQDQYPDIHFILIDGEPHDQVGNYATAINTCAIMYQEDQAGYLAGYAAVKEGCKRLGYMGGMAVPSVKRYGYGFVQGAEAAAADMGIDDLEMNYVYTGSFEATDEAEAQALAWYRSGTEVIFACGGAVGNSVMSAAEQANCQVIGVDVDQSYDSPTILTSATKNLTDSVYQTIDDYYQEHFKGGQTITFNASTNGIGLPMEQSRFKQFTQQDYDQLFEQLANGKVVPLNDHDIDDVTEIPLEHLNLHVIDTQ